MSTDHLAVAENHRLAMPDAVRQAAEALIVCWSSTVEDERLAWTGDTPGRPPVGYLRGPGGVEPDRQRAETVSALFHDVASSGSIASALATARRSLTAPIGDDVAPRAITDEHVERLLGNPFYVGIVAFRGRAFVGSHQPLVDMATFLAVQRVLAGRRSDLITGVRDVPEVSSILRCHACGRAMVLRRARDFDDRTVEYLSCLGRHAEGIDCPAPAVEAAAVRSAIAELLASMRIGATRLERLVAVVSTDIVSGRNAEPQLAVAVDHVARLIDRIADLYPISTTAHERRFLRSVFVDVQVDLDGVVSADATPLIAAVLDLSRTLEPPAAEPDEHRHGADATRSGIARRTDEEAASAGESETPEIDGPDDLVDEVPARRLRRRWVRSHTVATASFVLMVWWTFVRGISETDFDDLGVIGALPLVAFVAPIVVIGLLAVAVADGARDRVKLYLVGVLTTMLYGIGSLAGNVLQARIVFRHEGIADAIFRTGSVDPTIDAYFNWPGFFSFLALARHVSGVENFGLLSLWAPVIFNILYVLPTVVIARTLGFHERVVWGAAVTLLLGNWVGQDYLSPQASAFFVYLVVIAALLLSVEGGDPVARRERVTVVALVIVLFAAIVPSHQLTPIVTLMTVAALAIVRGTKARWLPLVMAAILLSWLVFMSATYLQGNLQKMLDLVGDVGAAGSSNVTERLGGSSGHQQVVRLRLLYTGIIGLVAAVGWLWSIRRRRFHWSLTAAVATPALMMILQPYGGEMILRVFFFALPFLAIYVASVMLGDGLQGRRRRSRIGAVLLAILIALPMFFVTRYGNSRLDIFTADEEQAIEFLYEEAEPGSLMLALVDNLPWKHRQYELHDYETVDRTVVATLDPRVVSQATVALMYSDRSRPAYLIVSSSQQTYIDLLGGLPPDSVSATEALVRADPGIVTLVERPSIRIYQLPAEVHR